MKLARVLGWTLFGASWLFVCMVAAAFVWQLGPMAAICALALLWLANVLAARSRPAWLFATAFGADFGCVLGAVFALDRGGHWNGWTVIFPVAGLTAVIACGVPGSALMLVQRLRRPKDALPEPVAERSPRYEPPD